jgi:hypothetical protein
MKSIGNKQNWARWNGPLWVNFHDYFYTDGSVLTVVRYRSGGKGWTRDILGKYRRVNGAFSVLRSDDTYKDEEPSTWWEPTKMLGLRRDLTGAIE